MSSIMAAQYRDYKLTAQNGATGLKSRPSKRCPWFQANPTTTTWRGKCL